VNIVVAMKQIPDLHQIRIRNRKPILEDVPLTLGSIDKNALETAVNLRESLGGKVIVVSVGSEEVEETAKEALAAGADEAYLVVDSRFGIGEVESSIVARALAAAIGRMEDVGLILFGEGSGDNYSGQVGPRVAEILGMPQVGYAQAVEIDGNSAVVTRSLEDCEEILEVKLPAVITVLADINEPRIPSVSQILKAGRKPKTVMDVDKLDLVLTDESKVVTLSNLAPENKRKQIAVKNVDELVQALNQEGLIGR